MSLGSIGLDAYTKTRNAISSLTVVQLKPILKAEGQLVSGPKTLLLTRLEGRLQDIYSRNDVHGFRRLTDLITQPSGTTSQYSSPSSSTSFNHHHHTPSAYGTPSSWHNHSNGHGVVQLNFKESPFHDTLAKLSSVQTLKAVEATRSTHEFNCRLPMELASKFDRGATDRGSYKVLLVGASDPVSTFSKLDIAYPHQFEVKINGNEIRANWKGLKNKPGTTRPADVTEFIRKTGNYDNTITITYALTNKRFYLRLDLVRQKSIDSLVQKLRDGKTISKEQVLRDMRSKAMDSDIVATSTVMSLKCPLSYTRLKNPCRGNQCNHNQCFDAMSYLQLQQQAPTWTCPICNKPATFENLQIDQYVADIVESVSSDVEQVTISPEGQWSRVDPNESNRGNSGIKSEDDSDDDDDDDLVEVSNPPSFRNSISRPPTQSVSLTATPTPVTPRGQPTTGTGSIRNSNNKRPHEVVDLTLDSSDEDVSPAPKRASGPAAIPSLPHGYSQHLNVNDFSNGHRHSTSGISFGFPQSRPPHPSRPFSNGMDGYR